METTANATNAEVIASLKYAAGNNGLETNLYSRYEEVLTESTITNFGFRGGVSIGFETISATIFGRFK
ncbi:hypothetical protein APS56_02325 [Pseudalgibacter alginicilyticus]|uniref:Uncharacterized protein n=1 Tax=Pseudalgibacter alginicilyticus TaxID=1736674 RepID=A0A0N7HY24_9FLAO|nr:hypothetical protein [Pseudalgibacter alginicilyticus]ALJ04062.1 hypothetical protein APS56_02325 [Pseudalgibacter alginicilyticus]